MSYWEQLVSVALLGTERQGLPEGETGALASLQSGLPQDRELALLGMAGLWGAYQRAGLVLQHSIGDTEAWPSTPTDHKPFINSKSAAYLNRMFGGEHIDLVGEWLIAVAKVGKQISPVMLPGILELGKSKDELREQILPVLGERGQWLARQNPEWAWAVAGEDYQETFETGQGAARVQALKSLRTQDPAKARAMLEKSWSQETPQDRAGFLQVLEHQLSMEDEPFLEAVLDDKRKEVRQVAAGLLARLPESRLVRQMIERVKPLISYTPSKSAGILGRLIRPGGSSLQVTLPEACDKTMERDGIEKKNVPHGVGEKAWWLQQMVAMVPPSVWGKPAELIPALDKEWRDLLLRAWNEAAWRFRDEAWAEALLELNLNQTTHNNFINLLLEVLPVQRAEQVLIKALHNSKFLSDGPFPEWKQGWGLELSRAFLRASNPSGNRTRLSWVISSLGSLVARWPVEILPEFARWVEQIPEDSGWMKKRAEEALEKLEFRQEVLKELGV